MSSIAEHTMNVEALRSAIRAFAPVQAEGIEYLYVLLDDSMKRGYAAGAYDAAQRVEEERDNAYDCGYLDGVDDARARPAKADSVVQDILEDLQAEAYEAEDESTEEGTTAKVNAQVEGAAWPEGLRYADADEAQLEAWKAYDRQAFFQ